MSNPHEHDSPQALRQRRTSVAGALPPPGERGSVLLLALLVSMVILGAGMASMWLARGTSQVGANITRRAEALYAAEAGLERARALLAANPEKWDTYLKGCGSSADDPAVRGNVLCDGAQPLALIQVVQGETAKAVTGTTDVAYTVYIRNDPAEWAFCDGIGDIGDCNGDGKADAVDVGLRATDNDGRVILRVEAAGRGGLSFFGVEQVVIKGRPPKTLSRSNQEGGTQFGQYSAEGKVAPPGP